MLEFQNYDPNDDDNDDQDYANSGVDVDPDCVDDSWNDDMDTVAD